MLNNTYSPYSNLMNELSIGSIVVFSKDTTQREDTPLRINLYEEIHQLEINHTKCHDFSYEKTYLSI